MQSVSVIVPTFRRAATLDRTLQALTSVDYPPELLELIIVDDAADDATASVVQDAQRRGPRIEFLRQSRRGAAAARNAGAARAGGDILLFCDDDMVVAPDHVELHVATQERFRNAFVGGERWYSPESLRALESTSFGRYRVALERSFRSAIDEEPVGADCVETSTLPSCDLSVARAVFWSLGGFDDQFPYAGAEDQDLCLRARAAGVRLIRNLAIRPLHNDPTVTLGEFAAREERGAHTVVALSRKHPQTLGAFADNDPLHRGDSPRLMVKKLTKAALSSHRILTPVGRIVEVLERAGMSDARLWRLYRIVIGLYIFRGYREALGHSPSDVSAAAGSP